MSIQESEANELLGIPTAETGAKKKKTLLKPIEGLQPSQSEILLSAEALATELSVTKERLERVTEEMEGMRSEMEILRNAQPNTQTTAPKKIFALGFIPSVVLTKNNVELLKWVTEVLTPKMKERMALTPNYFRVVEDVAGVEAVGIRTCPVFNRIERCALKWHHHTKITRAGRERADLRLHCCTLCMEALGIICGHPLLRCPWIFEDTWRRISQDNVE
jgi:hypothetical protein